MLKMADVTAILDVPAVYSIWQRPFVEEKLAPLLRHNDLRSARRVLDVGCGPGTNAPLFEGMDGYLGLDLNPRYVATARRKYGPKFRVADVRLYTARGGEEFDFILINSLLHHLDDEEVVHILTQMERQLTPDGHVHILDLVLPSERGISRWLALHDRGDHARPLERWRELFQSVFETEVFEPYDVNGWGKPLWRMVYFKGGPKS